MSELTPEDVRRYDRHIILPQAGMEGQRKLKRSKVLIAGAGGLGSPLGLYLAAAGVGKIGIADFDAVELSNLQRQVLYSTDAVGKSKVDAAKKRLSELNPSIEIEAVHARLDSKNALDIIREYDIVADGTDNFNARYLLNDACVLLGKPDVYGSVFQFEGQVAVFWARRGPCYRCLHPEPPPPGLIRSCADGGVLGVLPGAIGALQAAEVLKLILGVGEPLVGRLLLFDALSMDCRKLSLRKNPDCPVCGVRPSIVALADREGACAGRSPRQGPEPAGTVEISVEELKDRLDRGQPPCLLDVREPSEHQGFSLPNARLIPLDQLQRRVQELDPGSDIVVFCRSGVRSAQAVDFLRSKGFGKTVSLSGGTLAWAQAWKKGTMDATAHFL